ncbi:MAG: ABC transporter substrate-binding protein [Pseudomonadota bacterium]
MKTLIRVALSSAAALAFAGAAFADARTESFVQDNGGQALETLNDPTLDAAARTEKFKQYMDEFADFDSIARFVIGKYARRFSEEELAAYTAAFRQYALTNYEVQFDQYRGEGITVVGSTDRERTSGRTSLDSIVNSTIAQEDGDVLEVKWRVLERDGELQIFDVGLNLDGNLLWLAIEQRAQFLALLDRSNGSAEALIAKLNELTAELEAERAAS